MPVMNCELPCGDPWLHGIDAADRDDPEAVAHAMSRVASETERITRLVEDLLLLARLDSGRPLERGPVDMSRLAVDAVSDAHVAGPDHQWALDLPPNRWSSRVMRHGCTRW